MNTKVLNGILHTHLIYFNRSLFIFSYLSLFPFLSCFPFHILIAPICFCGLCSYLRLHTWEKTHNMCLHADGLFLFPWSLHLFSCKWHHSILSHVWGSLPHMDTPVSSFVCLVNSRTVLGGLHTSVFMSSAVICVRMQAALLDADSGEHAQKWESWVTWATTFLKAVNTCQLKGLDEDCEQKLRDVSRLWCL